ncbi:HhH-GPD-type base excision DNA repair protein [Gordonia rubripertincta]|uniref:Fe-S cluster assembly protein HesB n=1 Tax=Gordonia rubripertincta TaxID=36822 RepID=A0ABT4MNV9_GORRU|nr:HhH-GPD-type base excision DNA repair protein [Gordonia rubripertincta]MCZ4548683.1 Fe-S cluster assembly protein HesB [Gordonia rubripertincta]
MTREICIAQDPAADELLSKDDFALVVGMTLDQQYPMEAAFKGPQKIAERMDGFDIHRIAESDPDEFVALCSVTPAIHRFPGSMAKRVHDLATVIVDDYGGTPSAIWTEGDPDGKTVLKRLKALPGWGDMKARIFLALLGKQLGVDPKGWREAAGHYGDDGSRRSVADVVDNATLQEVREFKKQQKAAAKAKAG